MNIPGTWQDAMISAWEREIFGLDRDSPAGYRFVARGEGLGSASNQALLEQH